VKKDDKDNQAKEQITKRKIDKDPRKVVQPLRTKNLEQTNITDKYR
jgi:hypothetical protein